MLLVIVFIESIELSINIHLLQPRDKASNPKAPLPANKSITSKLFIFTLTDLECFNILKIVSLYLEEVGLALEDLGVFICLFLCFPAIILIKINLFKYIRT